MCFVAKQGGTAEILRPCNIDLLQGRILYLRKTDCRLTNNQPAFYVKESAL